MSSQAATRPMGSPGVGAVTHRESQSEARCRPTARSDSREARSRASDRNAQRRMRAAPRRRRDHIGFANFGAPTGAPVSAITAERNSLVATTCSAAGRWTSCAVVAVAVVAGEAGRRQRQPQLLSGRRFSARLSVLPALAVRKPTPRGCVRLPRRRWRRVVLG